MTNEELEQKLQEAANEIEPRDFDEIWREIEPIVTKPPQEKKKFFWKRWTPLFATLGVAIICAVAIPVALSQGDNTGNSSQSSETESADSDISLPPEEVYLEDELFTSLVTETEFYQYIGQTDMQLLDLTKFTATSCFISKTGDDIVKGGALELLDNADAPTCVIALKFYDKNIEVSEGTNVSYNANYTTESGAVVAYTCSEVNGAIKYYAKAEYKDLQYYLEYTTVADEGTAFFDTLFS